MTKNTAFDCPTCNGSGRLMSILDAVSERFAVVSRPCETCNGKGFLTKADLITRPADVTLESGQLIPIPLTGAFRVYVDGKIYQRKMTSRQLFKLANYALTVALETQNYETD
jgi:DnaJ-class molecular chaperone